MRVFLVEPVGCLEFLSLQQAATVVITDSGGIQEETTYLGIPCLTVRKNTERPVTVTLGTNILVGQDMNRLKGGVFDILNGETKQGSIPPFGMGGLVNALPMLSVRKLSVFLMPAISVEG